MIVLYCVYSENLKRGGDLSFTEGLIETLKEWEELSDTGSTDLKGLVSIALLQLGGIEDIRKADYNENSLDYLIEKIMFFEKKGIFEEFLVYGILNVLDDFFTSQIYNHGTYLINNEKLYVNAKEVGEIDLKEFISERKKDDEYYRSSDYIFDKEAELDLWNIVKAKHFNKTNIREWDLNKAIQTAQNYKGTLSEDEEME